MSIRDPNLTCTPAYIRAGQAIFTISNGGGSHYTYAVEMVEPNPPRYPNPSWLAKILTGPDNWTYMGMVVFPSNDVIGDPTLKFTAKSTWRNPNAPSVKTFTYALRAIWQGARGTYTLPRHITIRHNGTCGRCGSRLTHPASIDTGFGPECAGMVGVPWMENPRRFTDKLTDYMFDSNDGHPETGTGAG